MSSQFYTILAVVAGSAAGYKMNFPAGAMVGGLLAGLIVKAVLMIGLEAKLDWLSFLSQTLVAIVLVRGSDFSSLRDLPKYLPAAFAYSMMLLVFTLGMAWLFSHLCKMDFLTSLFATTPGGLTGIAVVAVDIGADPAISVLFNICRIVTVLIAVPVLANLIVRH